MAHAFQFVNSATVSGIGTPAVLLDLDNGTPFGILDDSSVSPTSIRRTTAAGIRTDGEIEVSTAYDAREITLSLMIEEVSAESQSTSIQTLHRILDRREGAWLKWQSEGMVKPLFYRTRRASADVLDQILDATPLRRLKIELSADPFGYGLPETGTVTITNDPTTGTNKMLAALPTIKGDVTAPLNLSFPTPDGVHGIRVASLIDYDNGALTAPYYKSLASGTVIAAPPAGWTVVDAADATMVGGNRRRFTKSSGTLLCRPTTAVVQQWASLPPGDYRVMIRTGAAPAGTELLFFNRPPSTGSELIYSEAVGKAVITTANAGKDWFDLGVVAMPGGAPLTDVAFNNPGATGPALWNVAVHFTGATGTIDLDAIVLIPAGRPNTITRHGTATFPATYGTRTVTWDGQNYYRIANGISTHTAGVTSVVSASEVTGGDPIVGPGATNFLHFFETTADPASASRVSDDKALTTVVSWSYNPRYLYNRPDTT
jgi:hypothetical protein